jgi:zeaxanthin glucosyltransferase
MSTLVFAMLNESGHLNPTYKLGKALRARGHDVRYLAIADVRTQIEAQGFAVEPLYPDLFPEGLLAREEQLGSIAKRRAITQRFEALLERLLTEPPLALERVLPDLLLIDVTQTALALWARHAGVPFVYVNTSLPQTRDPGVAPLRSGIVFGEDRIHRTRADLAWRTFLGQRGASAKAAALAGMAPPYSLAYDAAPRFGVPLEEVDRATVYMPQLRGVPELVLCPPEFDFPREPRPDRHFVESIDLDRREAEFAWEALPISKPLVYASLGGQRYRANETPAFFDRLLDAIASRPDYHLLLSVGRHVAPSALGHVPDNATIVTFAPQLTVLKRANVMVTHGGLGSVKECIMRGVPMMVCPLAVDQPGNGARVEHHGLGLRVDLRATSARELASVLDRLLGEAPFRERCAAMGERFAELETSGPGAAIVERLLAR